MSLLLISLLIGRVENERARPTVIQNNGRCGTARTVFELVKGRGAEKWLAGLAIRNRGFLCEAGGD